MNEPEILEAYRDLSTPVSAPADLLERVERRIKHRRTARRGVVALTVLAIAGGVGVQALGGGEGDGDRIAADPTTGDSSSLTFIDADGQPHTFRPEDIGLTCVTGTKRNGDPGPQTVVLARNEVITAMETKVGMDAALEVRPVLHVEVQVDKVAPGQTFPLPFDVDGGSDRRPMTFFFTSGDGGDRDNELSSAEGGASGKVTVHEASCDPTPTLWLEIDGTLGSEVEQPALAIEGQYRS